MRGLTTGKGGPHPKKKRVQTRAALLALCSSRGDRTQSVTLINSRMEGV